MRMFRSGISLLLLAIVMSTSLVPVRAMAEEQLDVQLEESGSVTLPREASKALWLNFYSGAIVALDTSARLREALAAQGFKFSRSENDARVTVNISGFVRLYNDKRSYDTGKVFLGELIEPNIEFKGYSHVAAPTKQLLASDAGVARQATQAGVPGGAIGGLGVAILTDWLADATGLRSALNQSLRNALGSKGGRSVLFCGTNCKRTTHEVSLTLTVWEGQQSSSRTLTFRQVAPDIDETLVVPMAERGLSQLLEELVKASRS